jgi:dephospho-CoA kinase
MVAGLTGGIGSGKSTVAQLFALLGWKHFNSDQVARDLYAEPAIKKKVIVLLGESAYFRDGRLNKNHISTQVFNAPALLKELNALIHPAVGEKFQDFCRKHSNASILKESALLFETGIDKHLDKVILVVAPDDLRIQRVMERDKLSRDLVISKLKNQMPQEEKIKKAHAIIVNDEHHSLIEQVLKLHKELYQD